MKNKIRTLTTCVLLAGLSHTHAELVVSNFFYPGTSSLEVGKDSFGEITQWAGAFTTGTHAGGYELDSISLFFDPDASGTPGSITIQIFDDVANAPGSVLPGAGDLTLSSGNPLVSGSASFEALPSMPSVLAPETTYWAVFSADVSGSPDFSYYNWLASLDSSFDDVSGDGWSIFPSASVYRDSIGFWSLESEAPLMEIFATAVPEPLFSSLFFGLSVFGFTALRRRVGRP